MAKRPSPRDVGRDYCEKLKLRPLGYMNTWMSHKGSAPHQGSVCSLTRATLTIDKESSGYTNPEHVLQGLEHYSHVWLVFLFHLHPPYHKAKVRPPRRVTADRVGVCACRSPHRLNPIGLTLTKLDRVQGDTLYVSGVDLVSGTPVIDIKPYIPDYDCPRLPTAAAHPTTSCRLTDMLETSGDSRILHEDNMRDDHSAEEVKTVDGVKHVEAKDGDRAKSTCANIISDVETTRHNDFGPDLIAESDGSVVHVPEWVSARNAQSARLRVSITPRAAHKLHQLYAVSDVEDGERRLRGQPEVLEALVSLLSQDPRSHYRRDKCKDQLFYHVIDCVELTCWCDDEDGVIEVLNVKPAPSVLR